MLKQGLIAAVALLQIAACTSAPSRSSAPASANVPSVEIGQEKRVFTDGLREWHLAVDRKARDEWVSKQVANDLTGLRQMIAAGRAFPVADNTRVLVLDLDAPGSVYVRVLEGPQANKTGWLNVERVH